MSSRFSEVVIECADPQRLADFWCQVLDFVVLDTDHGAIEVGPASGFGGLQPTLIFSPTAEPRKTKGRLHLDVNPVDRDQDAELERLLSIGARPADIGQTGDENWHVLLDPEDNEFCLLRRRLT